MPSLIDNVRDRVVARTTSLFAHAPYPLSDTLDHMGDPGLLGPDSVSWKVIGDASAFIGGIRALLVQAVHPEVVASLKDHSRYREDPLGRLSRTSAYVTATTYGALPEVEWAVAVVRRAHRPVVGTSHRGRPYSANDPALSAWVHNCLTDSFLAAYQYFGPEPLTEAEADRFVAEQCVIGRLLDAEPLPERARALEEWIAEHPDVGPSPGLVDAVEFLRSPPLPLIVKPAYRVLAAAAVATLPARLRSILDLNASRTALGAGRAAIRSLRWALGSSPSWHIALARAGADVPDGLFRQPLPHDAASKLADAG